MCVGVVLARDRSAQRIDTEEVRHEPDIDVATSYLTSIVRAGAGMHAAAGLEAGTLLELYEFEACLLSQSA